MAKSFSPIKLAETITEAISNSRTEYDRTNEASLSDAPEYFLTVNCFKRIKKNYDFLFPGMEWNVKSALSDIQEKKSNGKNKPGRPAKGARENGRFDIALWKNGIDLWGFIELKKGIRKKEHYKSDIERIRAVMNQANRYDYELYGYFAFYLNREDDENGKKKAEDKIEKYIEEMYEDVELSIKDECTTELYKGKSARYKGDLKHKAFQPFCFVFSQK